MSVLHFDKEATERLIAVYVTPDVVAQRNQFRRAFGARPGERVLDVGQGQGSWRQRSQRRWGEIAQSTSSV